MYDCMMNPRIIILGVNFFKIICMVKEYTLNSIQYTVWHSVSFLKKRAYPTLHCRHLGLIRLSPQYLWDSVPRLAIKIAVDQPYVKSYNMLLIPPRFMVCRKGGVYRLSHKNRSRPTKSKLLWAKFFLNIPQYLFKSN